MTPATLTATSYAPTTADPGAALTPASAPRPPASYVDSDRHRPEPAYPGSYVDSDRYRADPAHVGSYVDCDRYRADPARVGSYVSRPAMLAACER